MNAKATMSKWLLATTVAMAGLTGCAVEESAKDDAKDNASAETEALPAHLVATATHANGNVFGFYQNGDGTMLVVETSRAGNVPASIDADDGSMTSLFRAISPGAEVPEGLVQAERNLEHAQRNNLVGQNWLPTPSNYEPVPTPPVPAEGTFTPTDPSASALGLGDGIRDIIWFSNTYCDDVTADPHHKCLTGQRGNRSIDEGRLPRGRSMFLFPRGDSSRYDLDYASCWWRVGCRYKITGTVGDGFVTRVRTSAEMFGANFQVRPGPKATWHYANTYKAQGGQD